jgi:hypothetical protein
MNVTLTPANADRIVGRTIDDVYVAVAYQPAAGSPHGYALAVRNDGTAYAVFGVIPGPDREIRTVEAEYFDGCDYAHQDRMSHGHVGAYAAAHDFYDYLTGPRAAETFRAQTPEAFRDALTRTPAVARKHACMSRPVRFLRTVADLCGADAEAMGKSAAVRAILADY